MSRVIRKPLTVRIGDRDRSFAGIDEFEFCLAGRVDVPAKKLAVLAGMSTRELRREAESIRQVERVFVDMLARSIEEPGSLSTALRGVSLSVFSQDHGWRELMAALNELGADHEPYRCVAVAKYLQYLSSRQELVREVYRLRKAGGGIEAEESPTPAASASQSTPPPLRETVILELGEADLQGEPADGFVRLAKGEATPVALPAAGLRVRLSRHDVRIRGGADWRLEFRSGESWPLRVGRNLIGRDPACDISTSPSWKDVSRLHLVIERPESSGDALLTDLSAHGTWIVPQRS